MRTDLFDFDLPDDRIALEPATPRDAARLLVVRGERLDDMRVRDLPELLRPGDALVFNDTRVIRAALTGERLRGDNARGHLLQPAQARRRDRWRAFARPAKRLAAGDRIRFGHDGRVCLLGTLDATVSEIGEAGEVELCLQPARRRFSTRRSRRSAIRRCRPTSPASATVQPDDAERYQTIYARREGAVAAPTAGLHFTDELLGALQAQRTSRRHFVTLHVGAGTFLPVKAEETGEHRMHAEWGEISRRDCRRPERDARRGRAHRRGRAPHRCGCWRLRPDDDGRIRPFAGETDLFITPGYRFKAVDLLLTNFHLPRSTLFMLVRRSAASRRCSAPMRMPLRRGYRFYSYGDACLLHPAEISA